MKEKKTENPNCFSTILDPKSCYFLHVPSCCWNWNFRVLAFVFLSDDLWYWALNACGDQFGPLRMTVWTKAMFASGQVRSRQYTPPNPTSLFWAFEFPVKISTSDFNSSEISTATEISLADYTGPEWTSSLENAAVGCLQCFHQTAFAFFSISKWTILHAGFSQWFCLIFDAESSVMGRLGPKPFEYRLHFVQIQSLKQDMTQWSCPTYSMNPFQLPRRLPD